MSMPLTVLNILLYLPAPFFDLEHVPPRCIMHSDSVSCRGQTMANGSPVKFNYSSRAAGLVRIELHGWEFEVLQMHVFRTVIISVKSFDSSPPSSLPPSLPYYVSLGFGELSMFCTPQKNVSLAGLELPTVNERESAEPTSDISKIQSGSGSVGGRCHVSGGFQRARRWYRED